MPNKRNKKDEILLKEALDISISESYIRAINMDDDDYAYILAHKYFSIHKQELIGDDLFEGKKKIGSIVGLSFLNNQLIIRLDVLEPLHSILIDINLDELGKVEEGEDE